MLVSGKMIFPNLELFGESKRGEKFIWIFVQVWADQTKFSLNTALFFHLQWNQHKK